MHVVTYAYSPEGIDSVSELLRLGVMAECIALNCHLFQPEFEPVAGTMASHVKLKRDKVGAQDYDAQIKGKVAIPLYCFHGVSFTLIELCCGVIHMVV